MNGNPFTTNFIGSTGQYPIFNYINNTSNVLISKIAETSNALHNEILETSNITSNICYAISSNVGLLFKSEFGYFMNKDSDNEIYFNDKEKTKINDNGEILVYHSADNTLPNRAPGFWNVEGELTSLIRESIGARFDIVNLQVDTFDMHTLLAEHTASIAGLEATSLSQVGAIEGIEAQLLTIHATNGIQATAIAGLETQITATNAVVATKQDALTFTNPIINLGNNISLKYNLNQFNNNNNLLNIKSLPVSQITEETPTYAGGILTNIENSNLYITYTNNGTITFPVNITCDILVVGAGGKGYKGGGGSGEVIYLSNYLFNSGTYNINIGVDSLITSNRTTKIYQGSTDIIKANGGGDGGYNMFYQSTSNNTYTFNNSTPLIINNTNSIIYPAGTYTFSQNQGLLKIDTTIINTYPNLTGLNPYYWFKFNSNLNDSGSSGTLLNCTATGTLTYNTYDISNISSTNYINFGSISPYNIWSTYGMTFSFWIKGTATTGSSFYAFRFADGIGRRCVETFFTKTATNDNLTFSVGTGTSPTTYIYNTSLLNNNHHHIVWSINSAGNWYIYINNTLIINGTTTFTLTSASYTNKYIGYITSTNTGTHSISVKDFRIYRGVITSNQVNDLYLAKCDISILPTSGGSGGGGGLNQNGATAGTPNNINSQLNNGYNGTSILGGDGGSALLSGNGYTEIITGSNLIVGKGGTGGTSNSVPTTKINFGDGGDGNNGNGFQGLVIIKVPPFTYKTNFTGFTDWNKVENVLTTFPLSNSTGNNLTLKYDNTLTLDSSSNLRVYNPSLWIASNNNMYYTQGNIGIGIIPSTFELDVVGNINADYYYRSGVKQFVGTEIQNCNLSLSQGFIHPSILTTQTIPKIATNEINLKLTFSTISPKIDINNGAIFGTSDITQQLRVLTSATNANTPNSAIAFFGNTALTSGFAIYENGLSTYGSGTSLDLTIKTKNTSDKIYLKIGSVSVLDIYSYYADFRKQIAVQNAVTIQNYVTNEPVINFITNNNYYGGASFYDYRIIVKNNNIVFTNQNVSTTDKDVFTVYSNGDAKIYGNLGIGTTPTITNKLTINGNMQCDMSFQKLFYTTAMTYGTPIKTLFSGDGDRLILKAGDATTYGHIIGLDSTLNLWQNIPTGKSYKFLIENAEKLKIDSTDTTITGNIKIPLGNDFYVNNVSLANRLFNNNGNAYATYTNFNSPTQFGYNYIAGTTNAPSVASSGEFYSWDIGLGSQYSFGTYRAQFALPRNTLNPYLCVRFQESGVFNAWQKLSVGFADTAETLSTGNKTITGSLNLIGTNPSLYFQNGIPALGNASSAGAFSSSASTGDLVLRSDASKNLILQSGSGSSAITINSINNVSIPNILTVGNISTSTGTLFKRFYYQASLSPIGSSYYTNISLANLLTAYGYSTSTLIRVFELVIYGVNGGVLVGEAIYIGYVFTRTNTFDQYMQDVVVDNCNVVPSTFDNIIYTSSNSQSICCCIRPLHY